ncbi:MAG: MATE family efflux transporter [Firmicutes bacterium]|nr:MATE family efflux transporter [Bacillota bacterium]
MERRRDVPAKNRIEMRTGPIVPAVMRFALPLVLSSFLQFFFNAADTVVVGRFAGSRALAAVGATGTAVMLVSTMIMGLSTGASVVVSQAYGANDKKWLHRAVHTAVPLALLSGGIATVVGLLISRPLLVLISTPPDVIEQSLLYIRIIYCGQLAMAVYNYAAAILRAVGDSKRPLIFLVISGVMNVVLNLIFVIGFHLDVVGVAAATLLSQVVSAFLTLRCLIREEGAGYQVHLKEMRFYRNELIRMLRIGIPSGLQSAMFAIPNLMIQSAVNSFGTVTVAGNTAGANIETFQYAFMGSFMTTTMTFIGQNYGARQYARIRKILWTTMLLNFAFALGVGTLMRIFSPQLLSLYNTDPAVIVAGKLRIVLVASLLCLESFMDSFSAASRGMGRSLAPMLIALIGTCLFRIVWMQTAFRMVGTIEVVYYAYPLSWILTSIMQFFLWRHVSGSIPKENEPLPEAIS